MTASKPTRLLLLAATATLAAACGPDFDPASQVDKLRVLAVRAEPPEIAPPPASGAPVAPDRAALGALVVRGDVASDPARQTTVVYVACVPVPGDPSPSPCVALASLRDPTAALAGAAGASCAAPDEAAPVVFAGAEVCDAAGCGPAQVGGVTLPSPEVRLPAGYGFDALPASAPERVLGVEAAVLAFALDATPDELSGGSGPCPAAAVAERLSALWQAREHVLAVKRVQIRGPAAVDPPNRNPGIEGIAAGGAALASGAPATLAPGTAWLTPVLPAGEAGTPEAYTKLDATGTPITTAVEEWVFSWFGTAGELDDLRTRGAEAEEWILPAAGTRARVAAVVRDVRGGVAWAVRDVVVGP